MLVVIKNGLKEKLKLIDWEKIHCPICGEKRKNTNKNKVIYDPMLSEKKKGKMVFFCTNHDHRIHFCIQYFAVKDDIMSVRAYVFQDRLPKTGN